MNKKLEEGTVVRVFQDPLTGVKLEGMARLVEQIHSDTGDGISVWEVVFTSETQPYRRTINIENAFPPDEQGANLPTHSTHARCESVARAIEEIVLSFRSNPSQLTDVGLHVALGQIGVLAYREGMSAALSSLMDSSEVAAFFGVGEQQARRLITKANKAHGVGKRYGSKSKGLWLVPRDDLPLVAPQNRGICVQRNKPTGASND